MVTGTEADRPELTKTRTAPIANAGSAPILLFLTRYEY
jgi:hypothetical protein